MAVTFLWSTVGFLSAARRHLLLSSFLASLEECQTTGGEQMGKGFSENIYQGTMRCLVAGGADAAGAWVGTGPDSSVFWFSRQELDNVLNRAGTMLGMLNSCFETALQKKKNGL